MKSSKEIKDVWVVAMTKSKAEAVYADMAVEAARDAYAEAYAAADDAYKAYATIRIKLRRCLDRSAQEGREKMIAAVDDAYAEVDKAYEAFAEAYAAADDAYKATNKATNKATTKAYAEATMRINLRRCLDRSAQDGPKQ